MQYHTDNPLLKNAAHPEQLAAYKQTLQMIDNILSPRILTCTADEIAQKNVMLTQQLARLLTLLTDETEITPRDLFV